MHTQSLPNKLRFMRKRNYIWLMKAKRNVKQNMEICSDELRITSAECAITLEQYIAGYRDTPRFAELCKACNNYGRQWACPPFDFDTEKILDRYSKIRIFGYKAEIPERLKRTQFSEDEFLKIARQIGRLSRQIMDKRIIDLERNTTNSLAFYAGTCLLCGDDKCTRMLVPQQPCRFPELMRHSLENFGFNLSRTASELFNIPMLWAKEGFLPDYYLYICGLLF